MNPVPGESKKQNANRIIKATILDHIDGDTFRVKLANFRYQDELISKEIQQEICPLIVTQNAIAGRWKIVTLWYLSKNGVIRFNELLRMLPGISKGILTRQLRELEEDELVLTEVYDVVPPKVAYSLTEQGKKFIPVLEAMQVWGKDLLNKKIEMHERHED